MGIPLLRGRFLNQDDRLDSQLVVVINHRIAEQSWPGQNPVGKRLRIGSESMKTPWLTVVGEVADAKNAGPDEPTKQQFYIPLSQEEPSKGQRKTAGDVDGNFGYIAIRTSIPPEQMENVLRAAVREIDPQLPLDQVQTMEHVVAASEAPRSFNTALISAFAAAAVLLAILGIYSVIAFSVALRMQEIAIRMALGSQRVGIVRLILSSGAKLAVIGCAIGLVGALFASRLLGSMLFEVSAFDPLVLTAATLSVLLLALGATFLPARRAAAMDPITTLRAE
ncbi:FtsX-like permease family protein [Granulicella sibirica]|uniref:ABC transporter, ATP-binding protein n=1 Tax=Granulicella sibirica TaxID=2479048 RepID=A0A4Q0T1D3_9BACT|nr:ABC transporter, ATP-binding protein [Granulicella sibirica]